MWQVSPPWILRGGSRPHWLRGGGASPGAGGLRRASCGRFCNTAMTMGLRIKMGQEYRSVRGWYLEEGRCSDEGLGSIG